MTLSGFEAAPRMQPMIACLAVLGVVALTQGAFANGDAPQTDLSAQGNEPFWSIAVTGDAMILRRLGGDDIRFERTRTACDDDGARIVTGSAPALRLTATLELRPAICRDTMTGMPYPQTAHLALGDIEYAGCGGDPMDLLTGRDWQVTGIAGAPVPGDVTVTMAFDDAGRVTGAAGCNRFTAAAQLSGEGLTLGPGATTMMACPDPRMTVEGRFLDALDQVTGFDIDDDGALTLRGPDGPVIETAAR